MGSYYPRDRSGSPLHRVFFSVPAFSWKKNSSEPNRILIDEATKFLRRQQDFQHNAATFLGCQERRLKDSEENQFLGWWQWDFRRVVDKWRVILVARVHRGAWVSATCLSRSSFSRKLIFFCEPRQNSARVAKNGGIVYANFQRLARNPRRYEK